MWDLLKELWGFVKERKKLWLLPFIIIMMLIGLLLFLTQGSALGPFIYPLF